MTRNITSAFRTAIQAQNVNTTFLLIYIDFSTPVYYTTLSKQITWNSNTYTPSAGILEISAPSESVDFLIGTLNLVLTGANSSNVALALAEDYTDKSVIVRRAVMDASHTIIADPVIVYEGRLNSYRLEYSPQNKRNIVQWEVTSHWADFNRKRGRHTNNESQESIYSGDLGVEFASKSIESLKWGSE